MFGGGELPFIQEISNKITSEKKIDASLIDNYRNEYLALIAELNDSSSVFTDKELLDIFSLLGDSNPLTLEGRAKLSNLILKLDFLF
mgnify:CR=1 FL=1